MPARQNESDRFCSGRSVTMSTTPARAVHFSVGDDSIARVTLDCPGSKANTLTRQVWAELAEVCRQLRDRSEVVGLVLQSGKHGIWLGGADVRELAALPQDDSAPARELVKQGLEVLAALEALP